MIFVDPRKGSGELAKKFASYDVDVESETELPSADFVFAGYGPEDMITIGVERKEIGDMLNSMRSRRLSAFQVPNLLEYHDRGYLIIEGSFRPDPKGPYIQLLRGQGWETPSWLRSAIGYDELAGYLNSIEQSGISVLRTYGPHETVRLTLSLYRWWQKDWGSHKVFQQFQAPAPPGLVDLRALDPSNEKLPIRERRKTMVRLMSKELPGVGWTRSAQVAERFPTVKQMVAARSAAWQELEGIGPKTADTAVQLVGGRLRIDRFRGEYFFLSNFCDVRGTTVEHLYQAHKVDPADQETIDKILAQKTPGKARKMGRTVELRRDWDGMRMEIMRLHLDWKFSLPPFSDRLRATGDAELIQGNEHGDTFWGVCRGVGENRLGKMLMEVRGND